jgi:hypothetical protein
MDKNGNFRKKSLAAAGAGRQRRIPRGNRRHGDPPRCQGSGYSVQYFGDIR